MAGRPVLVIERIFEPPFRSTLPYFLLGEGGEKRRVITSIEPAAIPTFPREEKNPGNYFFEYLLVLQPMYHGSKQLLYE